MWFYYTPIWCHIPEDGILHSHHRENQKSYIVFSCISEFISSSFAKTVLPCTAVYVCNEQYSLLLRVFSQTHGKSLHLQACIEWKHSQYHFGIVYSSPAIEYMLFLAPLMIMTLVIMMRAKCNKHLSYGEMMKT
jgi:hypothetical protein